MASIATSYIQTTTAQVTRAADVYSAPTVTRSADVASITGTNFSSWFNASEGTIYAEYDTVNSASRNAAFLSDGTNNNRVGLTTVAGVYQSLRYASSSGNYFASDTVSYSSGQFVKSSFAYKASDQAFATSGRLVSVTPQVVLPSVTTLYVGADATGVNQLCGHLKRISYYPKRLSNTELQGITA